MRELKTFDLIGYDFADSDLMDLALSHRSWCTEQGGMPSNERLEFLGDAVLGLVVAEYTFHHRPELAEGIMAKVRAAVANTRVLAEIGGELSVGPALRLGRGEDLSGGRDKESILADTTEAIFGAVYLDGGFAAVQRLILGLLHARLEAAIAEPDEADHKSRLQEASVSLGRGVPRYEVTGHGPDHARRYRATVYVADQHLGLGEGRSKKDAEQVAARVACGALTEERVERDA